MSRYATNLQSFPPPAESDPAEPAWKQELQAKLAAHRERRSPAEPAGAGAHGSTPQSPENSNSAPPTAARVAARVAARYAEAPSYSEMLAASAAAAADAAESAAFAAQQAHNAAQLLLRDLAAREEEAQQAARAAASLASDHHLPEAPDARPLAGAAIIEHPEPLPVRSPLPPRPSATAQTGHTGIIDAFAEAEVPAAMGLPAKLIEFPRELVAVHRARPRIAEGPLVEEVAELRSLRIFEVNDVFQEQVAEQSNRQASEPASEMAEDLQQRHPGRRASFQENARSAQTAESTGPEWQSIRLGEHPLSAPESGRGLGSSPSADRAAARPLHTRALDAAPPLHVAPLGDRVMAALVDLCIVSMAFLVFVLVFAACTAHPPHDKTALATAALLLLGLFLLYGWLFMSYSGATPGMRYARIALCTFDDENPTRKTLRNRVTASLLSVLPLGLGILWALFDEDGLGWHDRLTRSYQRSYR